METLNVNFNGQKYLLFNLTIENVRQLENDPHALKEYFKNCLETEQNICIDNEAIHSFSSADQMLRNDSPSTSTQNINEDVQLMPSTRSNRKGTKYFFLCGKKEFIFGVKSSKYPWHYFDEIDSLISEHGLLPDKFLDAISKMTEVKTVGVNLNEKQSEIYFQNGEFVFKNKPLRTHLTIVGKQIGEKILEKETVHQKKKQLVFAPGETNPLMFIKDLENSKGIKSDKDKMYKLLDFVDDNYKGKFANLYFTGDWSSMKSSFLKLYTLPFVQNKKEELNISFDESETLRSFLERKLSALSKYTTLPFVNQVEMAMNDLPVEVASMFITEEKMICSEAEILAYCDTVQNLVHHFMKPTEKLPNEDELKVNEKSWLEVYEPHDEEEEVCPPKPKRGRGRGRGAVRGKVAKGDRKGIQKNAKSNALSTHASIPFDKDLDTILEDDVSMDFNFLDDVSNSSCSTWSEIN